MKTHHSKFDMSILWITRIWAALTLAFFVFMIGAHLFDGELGGGFTDVEERIAFGAMLGSLAGLTLCYKWELWGSVLSLLCFSVFAIAIPEVVTNLFFVGGVAVPAVLFLIYGVRSKLARSEGKILSI